MEKLELKCYELKSDFIVVTSQGMQAFLLLSRLLWQDKVNIYTTDKIKKVDYNTFKKQIIVTTTQFKYVFSNVPLQWGGDIDTTLLYANHIQELKKEGVI